MYKFDEKSEKELTLWMKENLGLAFFNFDNTSKEIGQIEEYLIQLAVPPLNLKDNPDNPYSAAIKTARKSCMEAARTNLIEINDNTQSQQLTQNDFIPRDIKQITLHEAMIEVFKIALIKPHHSNFLPMKSKIESCIFERTVNLPLQINLELGQTIPLNFLKISLEGKFGLKNKKDIPFYTKHTGDLSNKLRS